MNRLRLALIRLLVGKSTFVMNAKIRGTLSARGRSAYVIDSTILPPGDDREAYIDGAVSHLARAEREGDTYIADTFRTMLRNMGVTLSKCRDGYTWRTAN